MAADSDLLTCTTFPTGAGDISRLEQEIGSPLPIEPPLSHRSSVPPVNNVPLPNLYPSTLYPSPTCTVYPSPPVPLPHLHSAPLPHLYPSL